MSAEKVTLTEAEQGLLQVAAALYGWATQSDADEAVTKAVESIVAARVAEAVKQERAQLVVPDVDTLAMAMRASVAGLDTRSWNDLSLETRVLWRTQAAALIASGVVQTRAQVLAESASGPDSFWTPEEWREWSNELAALIPDGDESWYSNPEGAQEGIVLDCFRAYVAMLAKVEALAEEWEHLPEPPSEDYEGTPDGHHAWGEWSGLHYNGAKALRAALAEAGGDRD